MSFKKSAILIVIILGTVAFFIYGSAFLHTHISTTPAAQYIGGGWSLYTNARLGLSFEYPSNDMGPLSEEINGTSSVKVDNTQNDTKIPPGNEIKTIAAGIYPNVPTSITSVDQFLDPTGMGVAKNALHAQDVTVSGEKAVLYTGNDSPNNPSLSYKQTTVLFFHNEKMWYIQMVNIPSDEEERVWKRFRFTK